VSSRSLTAHSRSPTSSPLTLIEVDFFARDRRWHRLPRSKKSTSTHGHGPTPITRCHTCRPHPAWATERRPARLTTIARY